MGPPRMSSVGCEAGALLGFAGVLLDRLAPWDRGAVMWVGDGFAEAGTEAGDAAVGGWCDDRKGASCS